MAEASVSPREAVTMLSVQRLSELTLEAMKDAHAKSVAVGLSYPI